MKLLRKDEQTFCEIACKELWKSLESVKVKKMRYKSVEGLVIPTMKLIESTWGAGLRRRERRGVRACQEPFL